jgi:hypothetical protein
MSDLNIIVFGDQTVSDNPFLGKTESFEMMKEHTIILENPTTLRQCCTCIGFSTVPLQQNPHSNCPTRRAALWLFGTETRKYWAPRTNEDGDPNNDYLQATEDQNWIPQNIVDSVQEELHNFAYEREDNNVVSDNFLKEFLQVDGMNFLYMGEKRFFKNFNSIRSMFKAKQRVAAQVIWKFWKTVRGNTTSILALQFCKHAISLHGLKFRT